MFSDYIILSLKNIRKRGLRSWLTMLGIFLGIAAVVSLISLGNGLQSAITGQFSSLDPDKLTVSNINTGFGPPGATAVRKLTSHDADILRKVNGVDVVVERLIRTANVEYNEIAKFRYVADIPPDQKQIDVIYDSLNVKTESGRLITKDDRRKVVLGSDHDEKLFDKEIRVGSKIKIQGEEFEVAGILKKSSTFQINSVILMPQEDMKRVLGIDDEIDLLVIQVEDQNNLEQITENIEEALRKDRNLKVGEEDFSVETPEQSLSAINTILSVINLVVGGIAAISLLVGGIGIANTMYTSVLERTREIGVMKAVGARNKDILSLFLIESSLLGLTGGLIGAAIGLGLASLIAYGVSAAFPGISFSINISIPLILMSIGFSLLIGTLSGVLPAIRASNLQPVEALRA